MTLKEIYIARHGYRSNWLPPPHPPNPTGIDSDPPLAPHGVEQAKQLAAYLVSIPSEDSPQFILSSPFYRCVETAEPIARMLGLKIGLERGVGEWFRKGRNTIPVPANYNDLNKFFSEVLVEEKEWPRDHIGVIPSLEGESPEDILARAQNFWKAFIPQFEKEHSEISNILIVTHAATKIALGSALLQLETVTSPIDDSHAMLRAGACSLSKYIRADDTFATDNLKWNLVMNGNCEYLTQGEEMNWDFTTGVEAGSNEDIARRQHEAKKKKEEEEAAAAAATTTTTTAGTAKNGLGSEGSNVNQSREISEETSSTGPIVQSKEAVEDDMETFYITVDLPNLPRKREDYEEQMGSATSNHKPKKGTPKVKNYIIKSSAQLQFTDLSVETPLVKFSNNSNFGMDLKDSNSGVGSGVGSAGSVLGNTNGVHNIHTIDASELINDRIYETKWKKLIGSELLFDDYGDLIGQLKEHLVINDKARFELHKEQSNIDYDEWEEYNDGSVRPANGSSKKGQSAFWKKANKLARENEKRWD